MGFFDRFSGKKPAQPAPTPPPPADAEAPVATPGGVMPRLIAARERLEAKDLPGAMAIYDEILTESGDRADVLVTISADLGLNGHVEQIVELVAPRYDAERHGPATGLNLLQAYLAMRDPESAQHVLDLLFALNRPDLEDRLHGFSNAIAELIHAQHAGEVPLPAPSGGGPPVEAPKVSLVSISKPIWFYGHEPLAEKILPPKGARLRRVAFAQLATAGLGSPDEAARRTEDELARLGRALPLWLAETFYFSPHYTPRAALGVISGRYAVFSAEWTVDNLRQLVDTTEDGLDYIFTGAIRQNAGDFELILRVWEVKKFRERKQFTARWSPASADAELAKLHEQIRLFMEWTPEKTGLAYAPPASPTAWLDLLAASATLFLAEKGVLAKESVPAVDDLLARTATSAATSEVASLAFLALRNRAERLSLAARLPAVLASSPLIAQAEEIG